MQIHGIHLIEQDDMVIRHQKKTGQPFESESVDAWQLACLSGGIVFDVGAYTGLYALLAAKQGACVFAFEPNPAVFARLNENIDNNQFEGCGQIFAKQMAVSDVVGQCALVVNPRVQLTSGGAVVAGTGITTVTIDMLEVQDQIAAIKIDVEGHECAVIRGALATLRRCMPLIITEALNDAALRDQCSLLEPLGYTHTKADQWNIIWRPELH
ncbi:FkbM family methyltransferase [Aestuariicella hydrocarbonica]|uniref:FkbM family methyltransferase n=1 Tax=Pseudomaricurvus hydrocarbonicus TaxID=1470433 RepID=A0A9E5MGG2_9GAMM|nr:FkbM family methyltransferase [Aestuariicella hydrocarbonica]NHO64626.1 FkbM family methyltransferase [Aestuariicella hydrocarbonica]